MHTIQLNFAGVLNVDAPHPVAEDSPVRARLLLLMLARSRGAIAREQIMICLWPGDDERRRTPANLDNVVSDARALLHIEAGGPGRQAVQANKADRNLRLRRGPVPKLESEWSVETDLDQIHGGLRGSRDEQLQALGLVRGTLLHGVDGSGFPWLERERGRFRRELVTAVQELLAGNGSADEVVDSFFDSPDGDLRTAVEEALTQVVDEPVRWSDPSFVDDLGRAYPEDVRAASALRALFLPDKPIYRNARVHLRASVPGPENEDIYELRYHMTFRATMTEYVLALITRASVAEVLVSECPRISDSFSFSDDPSREEFIADLSVGNRLRLEVIDGTSSGSGVRRTQVPFEVLDPESAGEYLTDVDDTVTGDVMLCRAAVSSQNDLAERKFALTVLAENRLSEGYCYWLADRPTYVETVTVDHHGLPTNPKLLPLLATAYEVRDSEGVYEIDVEDWVVKNQGVVLVW